MNLALTLTVLFLIATQVLGDVKWHVGNTRSYVGKKNAVLKFVPALAQTIGWDPQYVAPFVSAMAQCVSTNKGIAILSLYLANQENIPNQYFLVPFGNIGDDWSRESSYSNPTTDYKSLGGPHLSEKDARIAVVEYDQGWIIVGYEGFPIPRVFCDIEPFLLPSVESTKHTELSPLDKEGNSPQLTTLATPPSTDEPVAINSEQVPPPEKPMEEIMV